MFTNTASIKNIIAQSAYISLANKYFDGEYVNLDTLVTDMDTVKNSNLEEEAFRFVNNYKIGKKIDFYFSSNYIYLTIEDSSIGIKMADFYKDIAIFNRFSNKTGIFNKEPEKKLLVFLNRYYGYRGNPYYTRIEEVKDGIFVDITFDECENKEINRLYDLCISQINDRIKNINKASNEAIIISLMIFPSVANNGNDILHLGGTVYYMPMDYYTENMFTKIIDKAQYPMENGSPEISYYDENFYEKTEYFSESRIYDLEKNVYYTEEQEYGYNYGVWGPITKVIKTYNAITGDLISEEDLLQNEKNHAIMNNMYN